MSIRVIFNSVMKFLSTKQRLQKHKIYDFRGLISGCDYVFEPTEDLKKGYITAQCKGIKRGDWIILQDGSYSYKYQVEEIDYYSEPPDMWMALLDILPTTQADGDSQPHD